MYLEIFLVDFAFFGEFRGISQKYLNFVGPRPRQISEALYIPANSLGFPRHLQVFHQISRSLSLSTKSPGKNLQLFCGHIQNVFINFIIFQGVKKENRK